MYNTDIRFGSACRNSGRDDFFSKQSGEKEVNARAASSSPASLKSEEGVTTSEASSEVLARSEASSPFSDQEIQQVETSSRSFDILKAGYRDSNRAAVVLGLAGGLVGGVHGGPSGASFGMSVGSTLGAHLGGMTGAIGEIGRSPTVPAINATEGGGLEQEPQDIARSHHFLGRMVQVVDHAGHHAALGSVGVGSAVLLGSLAIGIPVSAAFHIAGVYSGAVWGFGLTTGSAHWILRHVQQSEEAAQRESRSSPGDIELSRLEVVESSRSRSEITSKKEEGTVR